MTWTRLTDTWCDDPVFEGVDFAARWHYLSMIQHCSRTGRYDGTLRLVDARRCSDVDDPAAALGNLVVAGLVENVDGATVKVVRIDEHVPPPSVRDAAATTKVRVARHRKHKNGDHSECLPEKCPHRGNERSNALPQDGTETGRAVTGSALEPDEEAMLSELTDEERWSEVREAWGPGDAA